MMNSYTDPLTGQIIPPGIPIVTCRQGHINRADSWEVGNRCHHPGCRHRGTPTEAGVSTEAFEEITILSTTTNTDPSIMGLMSEDTENISDPSTILEETQFEESNSLDIQVLGRSQTTFEWWSTFWPTFLTAVVTSLVFGLALVTLRVTELINADNSSVTISNLLLNDIIKFGILGIVVSFGSSVLLTLFRLFSLRWRSNS